MPDPTTAELRRLLDIEEVRTVMYRYHRLCDGWGPDGTHRDPDGIAGLFTGDGVWDVVPGRPGARGSEEIAQRARELQSVPWIVHTVLNPFVEVDGDDATGEFKGLVRIRMTPTARPHWLLGVYRPDAVRTPRGWRLRSLTWEMLSTTGEPPPRAATARSTTPAGAAEPATGTVAEPSGRHDDHRALDA